MRTFLAAKRVVAFRNRVGELRMFDVDLFRKSS